MKAKENVKNNDINLQADTLIDLPVTDEQADETRGGTTGEHIDDIIVGAGPGSRAHIK